MLQKYKLICASAAAVTSASASAPAASYADEFDYAAAAGKLRSLYNALGESEFAERMAYFWFNRLCALRFMDVNGYYKGFMAVSPRGNSGVPEILAGAEAGHFDAELTPPKTVQCILTLLHRRLKWSPGAQGAQETISAPGAESTEDPSLKIYRLLLLATCEYWHKYMPFLFQVQTDCSALLIPDNLLSSDSLLLPLRDTLDETACKDVEVLGWLYQYYISDRKEQIYSGFRHNLKAGVHELPAATQVFTPRWIASYLAENTLGKLWLAQHPGSGLKEKFSSLLQPAHPGALPVSSTRLSSPEELTLCDPCCGSGHMLTCAFDLLAAIYAKEGYLPEEYAILILKHNLCGLEIDERAAELAAFTLCMKARACCRNFFSRGIRPQICSLQPLKFNHEEITFLTEQCGTDTRTLSELLSLFEHADNYGSLIVPPPSAQKLLERLRSLYPAGTADTVDSEGTASPYSFANSAGPTGPARPAGPAAPTRPAGAAATAALAHKLRLFLRQAELLERTYQVVITNPPYLGNRHMNEDLKTWLSCHYRDEKRDLMTAFISRGLKFLRPDGMLGMITLPSWLFLSSFEKLRLKLLSGWHLDSLIQMSNGVFGASFDSVAFVLSNQQEHGEPGVFRILYDPGTESNFKQKDVEEIRQLFLKADYNRFEKSQDEFAKIPGSPIVFWLPDKFYELFASHPSLGSRCHPAHGLTTGDNARFLRYWHEVSLHNINFAARSAAEAEASGCRWFPCNKGGVNRRWYGNQTYLINWEHDGFAIKHHRDATGKRHAIIENPGFYFRPAVSWSNVNSSSFSAFRYFPAGFIFDVSGMSLFAPDHPTLFSQLGFLNSKIASRLNLAVNPTINAQCGDIVKLPYIEIKSPRYLKLVEECVEIAREDWDSQENSWNFQTNALWRCRDGRRTECKDKGCSTRTAWETLKALSLERTRRLQELETENNRIINHELGLEALISPEVPRSEITLFCNPAYRYKDKKDKEEQWRLYRAGIIRDFISWATGCMFGRFAPDKPGLILASKGAGLEDYYAQIPMPLVTPCEDNILPVYCCAYTGADIVQRFKDFVKVIFGAEHYEENLKFIEDSLYPAPAEGDPAYTLHDYFYHEFYAEHIRRYHGHPIYWMFSSPKEGFMVLVYLQRLKPETATLVLTDYLRPCMDWLQERETALTARRSRPTLSAGARNNLNKELNRCSRQFRELQEYERTLLDFCQEQTEIDLNDGVCSNYLKFGRVLKKIPGLIQRL